MDDCKIYDAKGTECDYGAILDLAKKLQKQQLLTGLNNAITELDKILSMNKTDGKTCDTCTEKRILSNLSVRGMITKIGTISVSSEDIYILTHPGTNVVITLNKKINEKFLHSQGGRRKLRKTSKKTSKKKTSKKRKTSRRKGRK